MLNYLPSKNLDTPMDITQNPKALSSVQTTLPKGMTGVYQISRFVQLDAQGNLASYKPFTTPQKVEFSLINPKDTVFDFKTKKQVPIKNGKGVVEVAPGSGVILFCGSLAEFNKICAKIK
jgi:hypothetical protein